MTDRAIQIERAQNLWSSFVRSVEPLGRGACLIADPQLDFHEIGGLAGPKDEILTYACAATSPDVYQNWGTFPPTGILLVGMRGGGKNLLAQALATRTHTSFVRVDVPRLVLDVIHGRGKVGELIQGWSRVLEEMPPLTIFFDELEFSQAHDIGSPRADLPIGPIMDLLLELVDRTITAKEHLVVGSTGYPDSLRGGFAVRGRFERVVEVNPIFPDDIIAALEIHADKAEKRAGRQLFEPIDWRKVVDQSRDASTGEWVRVLHGVLRRKARCDAVGEQTSLVRTSDLSEEADRVGQARKRIHFSNGGNYL